eukprot:g3448.t1 g3448   contig12:2097572-2097892(+)
MVFVNDDESDLVYPNLTHCQIATSDALSQDGLTLPPPPPSASSLLKRIEDPNQSAYSKPSLERYDFKVEKEVLTRAKEREEKLAKKKGGEEQGLEVTLSDLKDTLG